MEIRRVQMTGGSSYIITLPKDWIRSLNIQKNDPVGLLVQSDGTLLITSKMERKSIQRMKEFDTDKITNQTYLLRRLIGAYISGFNAITLKSSARLPSAARLTVRNFTQMTIGQEVVEETDSHIVIKDLLNPSEMPFDRTIKRMYIIVKGMQEDIMTAMKTSDKQLAEDVMNRDNEVDRLHWLIARQNNIILQNVSFAEKMGTTTEVATTSFLISRIIERIGDHVIRIATTATHMLNKEIDRRMIEELTKASTLSADIFNKSIMSFFRKDIVAANQNIDSVAALERKCEKINQTALKQEGDIALSIGYIVESIRRIGEYAEDISETVINYLVGQNN